MQPVPLGCSLESAVLSSTADSAGMRAIWADGVPSTAPYGAAAAATPLRPGACDRIPQRPEACSVGARSADTPSPAACSFLSERSMFAARTRSPLADFDTIRHRRAGSAFCPDLMRQGGSPQPLQLRYNVGSGGYWLRCSLIGVADRVGGQPTVNALSATEETMPERHRSDRGLFGAAAPSYLTGDRARLAITRRRHSIEGLLKSWASRWHRRSLPSYRAASNFARRLGCPLRPLADTLPA